MCHLLFPFAIDSFQGFLHCICCDIKRVAAAQRALLVQQHIFTKLDLQSYYILLAFAAFSVLGVRVDVSTSKVKSLVKHELRI